jgi:hypothetical protein
LSTNERRLLKANNFFGRQNKGGGLRNLMKKPKRLKKYNKKNYVNRKK